MIIYLASPYTHARPDVSLQRYCWVCGLAARLIAKGHIVFSPIAHSHPIATYGIPSIKAEDSQGWLKQSLPWMVAAEALVIADFPGWEKSKGIQAEFMEAKRLGKQCLLIDSGSLEMKELVEWPVESK